MLLVSQGSEDVQRLGGLLRRGSVSGEDIREE